MNAPKMAASDALEEKSDLLRQTGDFRCSWSRDFRRAKDLTDLSDFRLRLTGDFRLPQEGGLQQAELKLVESS